MPSKRLQPTGRPGEAPAEVFEAEAPRPSAADLRQLARMDQRQPPAIMPEQSKTVLVNFRLSEKLADALAAAATKKGTTQKLILTRALAASGIAVPPEDLEDRTPRRKRRGFT